MPTKFGLHVTFGSRNGYGEVVAAAPAVVISVGEGGALLEAKEKSGGRTVTIYREQTVFHDAPQNIDHMSVTEARQAADEFWPQLKTAYDRNPADYYQVTNETGGDNRQALRNIFAFETRLMELAERDGYKLAVASPAGGSPGSWDLWVELFVPHIRRAGQGGHIYSRHAYGGVSSPSNGGFLTKPGPQPADGNAGRPMREAEYLRSQGINTPMVITEAGQNGGYQFPGADAFMEDMRRYDQLCMQHENIWGFCSWTYGNYQNRPANIQDASAAMAQYLRDVGGAQRPTYPVAGATPPPPILPVTGWTPPAEPLVAGFGFAESIERRNGLGRVTFVGGINLRNGASQGAARLGLVPAETIVRVTGETQNSYLPLQVAEAALRDRPGGVTLGAGVVHNRTFVSYQSDLGDFANVQPGRSFTATWTIQNSGNAAWSGNFRLAYADVAVPETTEYARSALSAAPQHTISALSGRDSVNPGDNVTLSLNLVAPTQPGWYASHWQLQTATGEAIGAPLWLRIQVVSSSVQPRPAPATGFQPGMNVNPDAHSPDVDRLRGLSWVRFVYKAAAKNRTVDEAFHNEYRTLIQNYVNAGINCLLILNQETVWGNAPWDHGGWDQYAAGFADAAGQIARLCAPFGAAVAFQIWNEEDSGEDNPSAIGIAAENMARILAAAANAIRPANSAAKIVIGGLNTGPENAINYVRRIQQALGGNLPLDALAYHPYGRYVHTDPFYERRFGTLPAALGSFRQAFPNLPLWITEIGVADNNPIGPEHYANIALYMREFVTEVATNHRNHVPVLIWFAWSDRMRNAGITTTGGEMKAHIGDVYREFVARGRPASPLESLGLESLAAADDCEFLRFDTTLENHNAVPAGSSFTNTWHFRNSGGTTWGDGYRVVYVPDGANSAPLAEKTAYDLAEVATPSTAAPGAEVAIQLAMTAPEPAGRLRRSRWQLRDPQGKAFGHFYAEITVVPAPTAGTGAHRADMTFVADHTVPDDSRYQEGQSFLKQWQVRNSGVRHWSNSFRLVFVDGDLQMAQGVPAHVAPPAADGEEVILSVPMVAPPARNGLPTTYQNVWRMQDDRGALFGNSLWARIVSLPGGTNTPLGRFHDPAGWYSQLDSRWAGLILGHGRQNIRDWGCLLTCYAMVLYALGVRLNPAELNSKLQPLGDDGFRGSNVQFAAPTLLLPGLVQVGNFRSWSDTDIPWSTWTGDDPIRRIDQALAAGQVVLAQVDRAPNNAYYNNGTEQHWVILLARTPAGDDYLALDPIISPERVMEQPLSLMRKYGNVVATNSHEKNLRNAIKSALIYRYGGGASG